MEHVRAPGTQRGKELRADLEHAHAELAATRRKIQELEQALAARAAEAGKWAERAKRQPRPALEGAGPALLGALLGALLSYGFFERMGQLPPSPESPPRPQWIYEPERYFP